MNLAEVFGGIATAEASEQSRLRLVEKSREHAQPLVAVLEKIKRVPADSEHGSFHVIEYSTWGGDSVFAVGLKARGKEKDDNTDMNWSKISSGPAYRSIKLFVSPDGSAAGVRWDQRREDTGYPGGQAPIQTRVKTVTELMPVLASWVEDNMPYAVERLIPKPSVSTGGHGLNG